MKFWLSRRNIEDVWIVLTSKGKTADVFLVQLMYVLRLRTGELKYLRFEDVSDSNSKN